VPAAVTVHLVRHAEHIHQGRVLVGRMPGIPLSETGRRQAERLADRLTAERIEAVHASPSERAQATARPIADRLGLPVQTAPEVDEIDFGDWTGAP
jgi:probable phosphoglycerate mutase